MTTTRLIKPGPRCWEGLAGVTYPEPETQEGRRQGGMGTKVARQRPDPQKWMHTNAAAAALHVSAGHTRGKLSALGVPAQRWGKAIYWHRREVEALAANSGFLAAPPPGWVDLAHACRLLACGHAMLYRYLQSGQLRSMFVLMAGRRRRLCHEGDVGVLAGLRGDNGR